MQPSGTAHNDIIHGWMPFEVFEKADAPKGKRRRIRGIISTQHVDLQGETVLQDGLDLTPIAAGQAWFNDNHNRATGHELGIPEKTWRVSVRDASGAIVPATAVEGYLLDTPEAERVWNNAQALQGTGRSYGFSVEGRVLSRDPLDPKIVRRAEVRQIAITRSPVNPNTKLEVLAKSLTAHMHKAMAVGALPAEVGVTLPGSAAPTVPQDLHGAARAPLNVQRFGDVDFDWQRFMQTGSAKAATRLSKAQARAYIRARRPDAPAHTIEALLQRAAR